MEEINIQRSIDMYEQDSQLGPYTRKFIALFGYPKWRNDEWLDSKWSTAIKRKCICELQILMSKGCQCDGK